MWWRVTDLFGGEPRFDGGGLLVGDLGGDVDRNRVAGRALEVQGKTPLLPFKNWTYPWGPWISIALNLVIVLVQGWSSFSPSFSAVDFVSYYIELPIMAVMFLGW